MSLPAPKSPDCYWVLPGKFLAGEYPGHPDDAEAKRKLQALVDPGYGSSCYMRAGASGAERHRETFRVSSRCRRDPAEASWREGAAGRRSGAPGGERPHGMTPADESGRVAVKRVADPSDQRHGRDRGAVKRTSTRERGQNEVLAQRC